MRWTTTAAHGGGVIARAAARWAQRRADREREGHLGGPLRAMRQRLRDLSGALTAPERALIEAVADAFFPTGGPIALSGTEAGARQYLAAYLERTAPIGQVLIRLLIAFTELGPLLFGPQRRRFTALSPANQRSFLQSAFTSRIYFRRIAFTSLRALVTMAYLSCPEVAQAMGMVADRNPFGVGAGGAGDGAPAVGQSATAGPQADTAEHRDPLKESGTRHSAATSRAAARRHPSRRQADR